MAAPSAINPAMTTTPAIPGHRRRSLCPRLLTGTGSSGPRQDRRATDAAGAGNRDLAIRRTNIGQAPGEPNLLDAPPARPLHHPAQHRGCHRKMRCTCRLARELLDGLRWSVGGAGRPCTLYPDVVQTLPAAETLVADGWVMVYPATT